jgi:hypothetical protein
MRPLEVTDHYDTREDATVAATLAIVGIGSDRPARLIGMVCAGVTVEKDGDRYAVTYRFVEATE